MKGHRMDKNGYPIMIENEMDRFEAELFQSGAFYANFKEMSIKKWKLNLCRTDVEYILNNKLYLNCTVTEDGKTMWTYKSLTTNEDVPIVNKSLLLAIDNYQRCCVN